MIADMIKNIVGDSANVEALMGVGVDPHLYKATQNDVSRLTEADMIFYNGLHLEGKMAEILENFSSQKSVTALGNAIDKSVLREVGQNTYDPHIWMSVALWKQIIPLVVKALSEKQPSNAEYFEKQSKVYTQKLEELDRKVKDSNIRNSRKSTCLDYFSRCFLLFWKRIRNGSTGIARNFNGFGSRNFRYE